MRILLVVVIGQGFEGFAAAGRVQFSNSEHVFFQRDAERGVIGAVHDVRPLHRHEGFIIVAAELLVFASLRDGLI
jgi:hypothetical protein